MSSPNADSSNPTNPAIDSAAAMWLARRDRGFTPEEAADFRRWLAQAPQHQIAVAEIELAWTALNDLQALRPGPATTQIDPDLLRPSRRGRVIPWKPVLAVAASIAIVFSLWTYAKFSRHGTSETLASSIYETRVAEQRTVTLADGSVLLLNTDSEVAVRLGPAERHIELRRGEVFFTVAKDPQRPFVVAADTISVRAVGTAFDVYRLPGQVDVLVTEGTVRITKSTTMAASPSAAADPLTVTAGQRTSVASHSTGLKSEAIPVSSKDISRVLSWRDGNLEFDAMPLGEVALAFNRYNLQKLKIADDQTRSLEISGRFQAGNVEAFVRLLEESFGVTAERPNPDTILLRHTSP